MILQERMWLPEGTILTNNNGHSLRILNTAYYSACVSYSKHHNKYKTVRSFGELIKKGYHISIMPLN